MELEQLNSNEEVLRLVPVSNEQENDVACNQVDQSRNIYDGEFTKRRAVIYTLSFTAKTYLYGPMNNQGVIKTVQSDLGADTDSPLARDERIVVVPNPTTADADDDFGFTTTISSFDDGKRYNPTTDTDVQEF